MVGLIGKPGFDIFTSMQILTGLTSYSTWVFCATTATIVFRSYG
mgnify:CR=1 FL=1